MNSLEQHVANCCKAQLSQADEDELSVAGFDFVILVPLLVQILTDLLGNCFNKASNADIAARLKKGNDDPKVRQAAWIAAGKATDGKQPKARQLKLSRGLCEACSTADDSQRMEFITGVKDATEVGFLI